MWRPPRYYVVGALAKGETVRELHDYRAILDSLEGALFPAALWSPRLFRFAWANPAFRRLVGSALEDLDPVGMPRRGFLSDAASATHMQDAAYIGLPHTVADYECSAFGGQSYWQVTYLPLQTHFADPFDVLVTAADVTAEVTARQASRARHEDALRSIGLVESTLLSSLDATEILERILVEATEVLDADWGWVAELADNTWWLRTTHGWPRESLDQPLGPSLAELPQLVALAGNPILEGSRSSSDPDHRAVMDREDLEAFALVPVRAHGEITRVVGLFWGRETEFTDAHREFVSRLSTSLSLAMQNAAAFALERGLRRTLQSALLPVTQTLGGFEVGHLCYSAAEDSTVGGDFYEILRLADDRLGVLIGDAPGHGLEAASSASLMRDTVRIEALRSSRPDKVVRRAERIVASAQGDDSRFTSLLYGSLEPASGRFRYCATGTPAPIIKRARGFATMLPHVYVREDPASTAFATSETKLDGGDLLVLFTDGLTEATNSEGDTFSANRLMDVLDRLSHVETGNIPEHLFEEVFSFAGGRLLDDVAVLAIRAA